MVKVVKRNVAARIATLSRCIYSELNTKRVDFKEFFYEVEPTAEPNPEPGSGAVGPLESGPQLRIPCGERLVCGRAELLANRAALGM